MSEGICDDHRTTYTNMQTCWAQLKKHLHMPIRVGLRILQNTDLEIFQRL